jgi:site-specific recombinase XerD
MSEVSFNKFFESEITANLDDLVINSIKKQFEQEIPIMLGVLQRYDKTVTAKEENKKAVKNFYLSKIRSKNLGYVYVVRYRDNNGNIIPSRQSTKTNVYDNAEQFAIKNREKFLEDYFAKHEAGNLYKDFANYYTGNSELYKTDIKRGDRKQICTKSMKEYNSFINEIFIPFMKNDQNRKNATDIGTTDIVSLQNMLLAKGIKGQSINKKISAVKKIYDSLLKSGKVKKTPFIGNLRLSGEAEAPGVYEIEELKAVFNKTWDNDLSYMLNLIIHTCGLRNEEISALLVSDIRDSFNNVKFNNYFLKVCSTIEGKNKNAKRTVPLHPFVYKKLIDYIQKNNRKGNDYIFDKIRGEDFETAGDKLGDLLGYDKAQLKEKNIVFYSGRHFYKTMLNAGGLGEDIEEFFMGHRVSADIKKNYNHKDKIGKENLEKKIALMFNIINETFSF